MAHQFALVQNDRSFIITEAPIKSSVRGELVEPLILFYMLIQRPFDKLRANVIGFLSHFARLIQHVHHSLQRDMYRLDADFSTVPL